jgi:hypothetical protein
MMGLEEIASGDLAESLHEGHGFRRAVDDAMGEGFSP